jgi:hypothetical protein
MRKLLSFLIAGGGVGRQRQAMARSCRLLAIAATAANPISSMAQVEGSGTTGTNSPVML